MELRYGIIDDNVRKRSVEDTILHERQRYEKRAGKAGTDGISVRERLAGLAGELAVIRAVNSEAARGMRADVFSPLVMMPPGTQEETLRSLYRGMCRAAFSLGVSVSAGHAEVTDAVNRPVVVTESLTRRPLCRTDQACREENKTGWCGADIIAAGLTGLEGSLILTAVYRQRLQEHFPESILVRMESLQAEDLCVLRQAEIAAETGQDLPVMVSLSAGGIFAGLWELSVRTGCGFTVDLPSVPIPQETIEITDLFGIHPYIMRSAGCLLAAVRDGGRLVSRLQEEGIYAAEIGSLNGTRDKLLRNGEEVRNLDRPQTDSLDLFLYKSDIKIRSSQQTVFKGI